MTTKAKKLTEDEAAWLALLHAMEGDVAPREERRTVQLQELADARAADEEVCEHGEPIGMPSRAWRRWPWQAGDVLFSNGPVVVKLLDGDPITGQHAVELEVSMGQAWGTRCSVRTGLTVDQRQRLARALAPELLGAVSWRPGMVVPVESIPAPPSDEERAKWKADACATHEKRDAEPASAPPLKFPADARNLDESDK